MEFDDTLHALRTNISAYKIRKTLYIASENVIDLEIGKHLTRIQKNQLTLPLLLMFTVVYQILFIRELTMALVIPELIIVQVKLLVIIKFVLKVKAVYGNGLIPLKINLFVWLLKK